MFIIDTSICKKWRKDHHTYKYRYRIGSKCGKKERHTGLKHNGKKVII